MTTTTGCGIVDNMKSKKAKVIHPELDLAFIHPEIVAPVNPKNAAERVLAASINLFKPLPPILPIKIIPSTPYISLRGNNRIDIKPRGDGAIQAYEMGLNQMENEDEDVWMEY